MSLEAYAEVMDAPAGDRPRTIAVRRSGMGQRLRSMTAAWAVLGLVVGAHGGWRIAPEPLTLISHMIAGLMVFSALGLVLGLVSGRARHSLVGGACGVLVGVVCGPLPGQGSLGESVDLCLVMGALAGATLLPWLQATWATIRALSRLLARRGHAPSP